MPTLSEIKAASIQPRTGVWFDVAEMRQAPSERNGEDVFYVCIAPRSDRAVMRTARALARSLTEKNGSALEGGSAEAIGLAAHIVDWDNLRDDDGTEIQCTPERAYRLLAEDCPEYCGDVALMVQLAAMQSSRTEAVEEGK